MTDFSFDPIDMNTNRIGFEPVQMGFDAAMDGYQYYECPNWLIRFWERFCWEYGWILYMEESKGVWLPNDR
jgi:hypothetical protein